MTQHVMRDFTSRTGIIRRTLLVTLIANTSIYTLDDLETGLEIVRVKACQMDGCRLRATAPEEVPDGLTGTPAMYIGLPPDQIQFVPTPVETGTVDVGLVAQTTSDTQSIPDEVTQRWLQQVSFGCLGRLFAMPNKQWTDAAAASYYLPLYEREVRRARHDADTQYRRIDFHTRPVRW
ncbi:MAG TPA: hypothetical protein VFQ88_12885 [Nevskiaceae bacterium]|nr:hypothetical protein [Nevskiaceae bacterium]